MGYILFMVEILETHTFAEWIDHLKDVQGRARILVRIDRLVHGLPGDVKPVGEGVSELRIDDGPGYRVYFKQHGNVLIILHAGAARRARPRTSKPP
jgi:putative addiction module killer protein